MGKVSAGEIFHAEKTLFLEMVLENKSSTEKIFQLISSAKFPSCEKLQSFARVIIAADKV